MPITDKLILEVNALTEAELIELNHAVIRNIKAIRTRRMDNIRDELSVGDRVTFTGRKRGRGGSRFPVVGKVTKIKRKNAEVKEEGTGLNWNVSISMLKPVQLNS